jgi:hypothetical protein
MFRLFVARHAKLPRTSSTKSAKAKKVSRRVGTKTRVRVVNAPKRW